jgi:hypothetical protein
VDGNLTIEAVADAGVWRVLVNDGTRVLPPGSDLEPGVFVEAFTSDGSTADFVITYDKPLQ